MSNYRRCYVPGGSFFFTVVTERRAGILANERARDCLRDAIGYCRGRLPFHVDALVILPDHVHAIWTMPQNDWDYSKPRRVRTAYHFQTVPLMYVPNKVRGAYPTFESFSWRSVCPIIADAMSRADRFSLLW